MDLEIRGARMLPTSVSVRCIDGAQEIRFSQVVVGVGGTVSGGELGVGEQVVAALVESCARGPFSEYSAVDTA